MIKRLEYPEIPFHGLLRRAAERWPEKGAILFHDRTLTFAQWNAEASRLASSLLALGLKKGDRVALYTPNCPEFEIAFMAAARMGAVPTPLNPSYKEREVRHQLTDSGAAAAVVHASLYPTVAAVRTEAPELRHVIVIGDMEGERSIEQLIAEGDQAPLDVEIAPEDIAALPYSSGTTGASKGVMLTQRNLVCNAMQFADSTASTERDVLLIFLPLYHIYGVALMGTALAAGCTQLLLERFDLGEVVRLVEEQGVTELYVVPPVMLALANALDLDADRFGSIRFAMSAAAPLAADVARRVAERLSIPVIQAYGMTESSPLTHMVPLDRWREDLGSVGVVAADTECRILDAELGERELPAGEVGEVVVTGPQVMAGYWRAPQETALTLHNGRLHTGDIGYEDTEGRLFIVDRKKEMIKYKAFSIAPAELEALLLEHPDVVDCAVIGQPDAEAGEVPRAFVVLRAGESTSCDELQSFVRERVASYKQIRAVEIVDAIPRTPSGKILRRVLRERAEAAAQR